MTPLFSKPSQKVLTVALYMAVVTGIAVIEFHTTTHASLIPVNLTPTTTLTKETSNNTSAYSGFPGWSNGDTKPGNVSKVNIHTLLYPGNTTKIFALVEPWFCTNTPGIVSATSTCQSHVQVGYNENTTAQVNAMVDDMVSRGVDGAVCDFYGTAYDAKTVGEQGVCDKIAAYVATKSNFTFMEMEDDGSWKWRCAGASSVSSCVQTTLETDLEYFNTHYYDNGNYYKVNNRPVVLYFVDEASMAMSASQWNSLWATVKTWATSHGNPLFVFENSSEGNVFTPFEDGSYGWPQPSVGTGWKSGNYLDYFYTNLNSSAIAFKQGTMYKGFNDTFASWSQNRIIDQQCGQVWANYIWAEPAAQGFNANHQLQSALIATWNDYEEGTETETGIDNCLSISATIASNILSWKVTGQTNTLDHYTIYISTDGQNLAVLADNISPSATSLDLSAYALNPGTYTFYVKAVGKPFITNHMSNGVTFSNHAGILAPAPAPRCVNASLLNSSVSATTTPGGNYTISCDYGFTGPGITVIPGTGSCTFSKFNGTTAIFQCAASSTPGTFHTTCEVGSWNTGNYCSVSNPIAALSVVPTSPSPVPSCAPGQFCGGSINPITVNPGNAYTISCNYGFAGNGITVAPGSGSCVYQKFSGTTAIFSCNAGTVPGTFTNYCRTYPASGAPFTINQFNAIGSLTIQSTAALPPPSNPASNLTSTHTPPSPPSNSGIDTQESITPPASNQGSSNTSGNNSGGGGGGFAPSSLPPTPTSPTSENSNQTSLSVLESLISQVKMLILQLNNQLTPSFTRDLHVGSMGSDVQNLQMFLNDNGYSVAQKGPGSPGSESLLFGTMTAQALAKFQAAHGLPATGYFGAMTRSFIQQNYASSTPQ